MVLVILLMLATAARADPPIRWWMEVNPCPRKTELTVVYLLSQPDQPMDPLGFPRYSSGAVGCKGDHGMEGIQTVFVPGTDGNLLVVRDEHWRRGRRVGQDDYGETGLLSDRWTWDSQGLVRRHQVYIRDVRVGDLRFDRGQRTRSRLWLPDQTPDARIRYSQDGYTVTAFLPGAGRCRVKVSYSSGVTLNTCPIGTTYGDYGADK